MFSLIVQAKHGQGKGSDVRNYGLNEGKLIFSPHGLIKKFL